MAQVRKDILNGWKEIGGYVCRDIRTVERWEKQRGLPVRRVPGAGRATVYALIPELDEWLASTKTSETETAVEDSPEEASELPPPISLAASTAVQPEPFHLTESVAVLEPAPPPVEAPTSPARGWRYPALLAGAAAILLAAAAFPLSRHYRSANEAPRYTLTPALPSPSLPYQSKVVGVDDLYLRGIYSYEQRTPDSLARSLQEFSDAIAKDPRYAPAYAGLANTYNLMREYAAMPDFEAFPKAQAAARTAVALDPKLPQAHVALGFVDFFWSHNAPNAEDEFRTAIALDPSSATAHHWYGSMLIHQGRFDEALQQLGLAQRLEPTSAAIFSTRALAMGLSGHRDEANGMLNELLSEVPSATSPHNTLATLSLIQPRDLKRYLDESRRVAELRQDHDMLQVISMASAAYRSGGEQAMWLAMLNAELRLHPAPSDGTYTIFQAEAALGRNDAAFADLNQLIQKRSPAVSGIKIDPALAAIRRDPRFNQALGLVGLPPNP